MAVHRKRDKKGRFVRTGKKRRRTGKKSRRRTGRRRRRGGKRARQ